MEESGCRNFSHACCLGSLSVGDYVFVKLLQFFVFLLEVLNVLVVVVFGVLGRYFVGLTLMLWIEDLDNNKE